MAVTVKLRSKKQGEINKFLTKFYNINTDIIESLEWKKEYQNPVELSDILGVFADNYKNFNIQMWICLDKNVYINITNKNANKIIKYLYERYPY